MATKSTAGDLFSKAKTAELKQRLLFLLIAIIVFRFGSHLTIPGISPTAFASKFKDMSNGSGGFLDMIDAFGGGSLKRFSVFALGIMPYISSSIIIQLMTKVVPSLEQLSKEGEAGKRKITQYTRYGTVLLGVFQSVGICTALYATYGDVQGQNVFFIDKYQFIFIGTVTLVTGTLFLMWLGEQITERGIGNGISMLIFAGIVSGFHDAFVSIRKNQDISSISVLILLILVVAVMAAIVFVERGQRRITVSYARGQNGQKQTSHLPFKLNMAGVIPPIFASAIVMFPNTIASFAGEGTWLQSMTQYIAHGEPLYIILFSAGVIFFCFFYTALVFNANETADNLKKSGAYIPGIRPGKQTAKYIDAILTRLTMAGAIYITLVCLMPEFIRMQWKGVSFNFSGTSLLIVVVVIMDFMAQVQAHLMSHHYDKILDKTNLKRKGNKSAVVKKK